MTLPLPLIFVPLSISLSFSLQKYFIVWRERGFLCDHAIRSAADALLLFIECFFFFFVTKIRILEFVLISNFGFFTFRSMPNVHLRKFYGIPVTA